MNVVVHFSDKTTRRLTRVKPSSVFGERFVAYETQEGTTLIFPYSNIHFIQESK